MLGRTRIVVVGLVAIGALSVGVGTAQAAPTRVAAAMPAAMPASIPSEGYAPAIRIPRPGQDDGRGGDFQAPRGVRTTAPSSAGQQAAGGAGPGGAASGGAASGGAAAVPAPGPVSGLLAPVVGALHL